MAKDKKFLVIPGAIWQVPLIKRIKDMGGRVTCVNPYDNSPGFAVSDDYIQSDIFDVDKYLPIAQTMGFDAVISDECDIVMPILARVSEALGLPSQTCEIASLFSNKYKMREFLKRNNLPYPEFSICHTKEDAISFYRKLNKLMVIKPLDSSSSHGVFTIHNEDELVDKFEEARSYSHSEHAVICERYIKGMEFTVDGIKSEHGHVCLAISEKKHYSYNENVAYELFYSQENPNYDYNRLREINDTYVNLSALPFGLTHAEYKYEDGEFYLIEIGSRGGGNLISVEIVPNLSGYDVYDALIRMSLGEPVKNVPCVSPSLWNRCAVLEFFDAPGEGGVVTRIEGEDFLKENKNILSYKLNFQVGDKILPAICDTARIGFYIAYADSREELVELMRQIEEKVKFFY